MALERNPAVCHALKEQKVGHYLLFVVCTTRQDKNIIWNDYLITSFTTTTYRTGRLHLMAIDGLTIRT